MISFPYLLEFHQQKYQFEQFFFLISGIYCLKIGVDLFCMFPREWCFQFIVYDVLYLTLCLQNVYHLSPQKKTHNQNCWKVCSIVRFDLHVR